MNEVDLSRRGMKQARSLGLYAERNGIQPTVIITSPAKRAVRTHHLSSKTVRNTIKAVEDDRLQELDWGEWTRQPRSIASTSEVRRARECLGLDFAPPGGESFNTVRQRALQVVQEIVRRQPRDHIWVHAHRNVIKALVQPWMGWSVSEISEAQLDVVSLTRLTYERGRLELVFFNRPTI